MVSSRVFNKSIISAVLLLAGCCLVHSYPSSTEDDERMMNDDYDYGSDDQSSPSQQNKPSSIAKAVLPKQLNRTVTKTGLIGEDVVLKCDESITKKNVILWYKDSTLVASGSSVILPNFKLGSNYELTILKASPQDAGDYFCHIMPEKVIISTKVILGDHSMDVIIPESSTSGQISFHDIDHSMDAIIPESSTSGQSSFHGIAFTWLLLVALVLQH